MTAFNHLEERTSTEGRRTRLAAVVHTYQRLQPRLAQAAKDRRWSKVAELYPRVRDAKTAMLKPPRKNRGVGL